MMHAARLDIRAPLQGLNTRKELGAPQEVGVQKTHPHPPGEFTQEEVRMSSFLSQLPGCRKKCAQSEADT